MPRNGSGVMSKPPNTTAQPNTTILSAMFNSVIDDIVADLNAARPVTAGGTGATSVSGAQSNLSLDNKVVFSVKSGNYTAVATDNNGYLLFLAPTPTLSLPPLATIGAHWHCWVKVGGGTLTIDPNASELINNAASLVLKDGQSVLIISAGTSFIATQVPVLEAANTWSGANTFTDGTNSVTIAPQGTIEICGLSFIDFKNVASDDFDVRLVQDGANGLAIIADGGVSLSAGLAIGPNGAISFLGTGAATTRANLGAGVQASAAVTMSAVASQDLTGIPAAVKRVRLKFDGVTKSAAGTLNLLLGTSGGMASTGYRAACSVAFQSAGGAQASTTNFILVINTTVAHDGWVELVRKAPGSNTWMLAGCIANAATQVLHPSGSCALGAELTQVRLIPASGTISGDVSIEWEF